MDNKFGIDSNLWSRMTYDQKAFCNKVLSGVDAKRLNMTKQLLQAQMGVLR